MRAIWDSGGVRQRFICLLFSFFDFSSIIDSLLFSSLLKHSGAYSVARVVDLIFHLFHGFPFAQSLKFTMDADIIHPLVEKRGNELELRNQDILFIG